MCRQRVLAAAIRTQAGRLLAARRTLSVADEALTASRSIRDLLERRASEGAIPQLEANLAALEMWRVEADRAFAAADAEAALIELKALAGLPADAPLALSDALEMLVRGDSTMAAPPAGPLAARTDIREAAARVAMAEARIEAARREGGLDARLFAGYTGMRLSFPEQGIGSTFHHLGGGATIMLPWRNQNQGTIAAAEAERTGAREQLAARELSAQAEIDAATVRDREARRAVELYTASIRALAQRNNDVILEAYELGGLRLTDLLDNQRRYLEIEHAYTGTLLKAYDARVALRRARGEI
jgi:cobalt-zinc-cadmium efflux system outer membrane protein